MPMKITTLGTGSDAATTGATGGGAGPSVSAAPFASALQQATQRPAAPASATPVSGAATILSVLANPGKPIQPSDVLKPVLTNVVQGSHVSGAAQLEDDTAEDFDGGVDDGED